MMIVSNMFSFSFLGNKKAQLYAGLLFTLAAEQDQDTGKQCQDRQHRPKASNGRYKCGKAHKDKVHSQQGHTNISVHRISSLLVDLQKGAHAPHRVKRKKRLFVA
jgi:hypothetical protein